MTCFLSACSSAIAVIQGAVFERQVHVHCRHSITASKKLAGGETEEPLTPKRYSPYVPSAVIGQSGANVSCASGADMATSRLPALLLLGSTFLDPFPAGIVSLVSAPIIELVEPKDHRR